METLLDIHNDLKAIGDQLQAIHALMTQEREERIQAATNTATFDCDKLGPNFVTQIIIESLKSMEKDTAVKFLKLCPRQRS